VVAEQINKQGNRRFWPNSMQVMLPLLQKNQALSLYEVIHPNSLCRLYFDLEYDKECNSKRPLLWDVCLPQLILDIADKVMQKQCDRASLWVLDASNKSKFSQHIIVGVHPHGYLGNVQQVGSVVKNVCDIAQHMDEFCALDGHHNKHCIIDTSVYSKNQQFRVMFCSKFEQQRPLVPINKLSAVSLHEN